MTAFLTLGRLTSHPRHKTRLTTRFHDSQPTINWASEPPNRTIFRCAIKGLIARLLPAETAPPETTAANNPRNDRRRRSARPEILHDHQIRDRSHPATRARSAGRCIKCGRVIIGWSAYQYGYFL